MNIRPILAAPRAITFAGLESTTKTLHKSDEDDIAELGKLFKLTEANVAAVTPNMPDTVTIHLQDTADNIDKVVLLGTGKSQMELPKYSRIDIHYPVYLLKENAGTEKKVFSINIGSGKDVIIKANQALEHLFTIVEKRFLVAKVI